MGIIRGSGVFVVSILLFFSFLAASSLFILSSSLKYENIQQGLTPVVGDIPGLASESILPSDLLGDFNTTKAAEDAIKQLQIYCNQLNYTEYSFQYEGYNFTIPCETVDMGTQAVINKTVQDIVEDIYYKEYDCSFFNCFSKYPVPFFLISQQAKDYWTNKFYYALLISIILIALLFLFVEYKQNGLIITGSLLILSALPLLKLGDLLYTIAGKFYVLIEIFLRNTKIVFWFSLIVGIILIGAGIALKFWHPGFVKGKLSKNEVKEIVKKETSKTKTQKTTKKKK